MATKPKDDEKGIIKPPTLPPKPPAPPLTLRDYLAGQAVSGIVLGAIEQSSRDSTRPDPAAIAKQSYAVADALIAESKKEEEPPADAA